MAPPPGKPRSRSILASMRPAILMLGLLLLAPLVAAQGGLSDIFRSVTGALRGGTQAAPQQQGATPVLGVRGMDEAEGQAAAPASDEYVLMEGWAAIKAEALAAAERRGLAARTAGFRKVADAAADKPN